MTHESVLVSSVMSFYFRDEALPFYGGGAAQARHLKANDFMYSALMNQLTGAAREYSTTDAARTVQVHMRSKRIGALKPTLALRVPSRARSGSAGIESKQSEI